MRDSIKNQNKDTLSLILNEAKLRADMLYNANSKSTDKSYVLFVIISSLITYSLSNIANNELSKDLKCLYLFLLIGSLVSAFVLLKNLLYKSVAFNGADPDNLNSKYFKLFKGEELELIYLAYLIEGYQKNIDDNRSTLNKSVTLFKYTLSILLPVLIVFIISYVALN